MKTEFTIKNISKKKLTKQIYTVPLLHRSTPFQIATTPSINNVRTNRKTSFYATSNVQLLTKPCKARVNTIPLQHRGAEHTADQHIANATAPGQRDFQFTLLSKLLHTKTSRTASSSVLLGLI